MTSAARKGWTAEHLFVEFARAQGFPYAERRRLAGREDRGDVIGFPGIVWQIKNHRKYEIGPWLAETEQQRINARAEIGILVVKAPRLGAAAVGQWPAIVPVATMLELVRDR